VTGGEGDNTPPPPVFVSVASKELSQTISLLFATPAGRVISVAVKRLKARVGGPDPVGIFAPRLMSGEKSVATLEGPEDASGMQKAYL